MILINLVPLSYCTNIVFVYIISYFRFKYCDVILRLIYFILIQFL